MIWIIRNNVICKTYKENISKNDRYATQKEVETLPSHIQKLAKVYVAENNNRSNGVQKTTKRKETTTGTKKSKQCL